MTRAITRKPKVTTAIVERKPTSTVVQDHWDKEDQSETFRKKTMDSLTTHLNCTSFYHKMRWPWLVENVYGLNYPMEVTRYYQEIKLAIDIGPAAKTKLKEDLCAKNGIKYVHITTATDLRALAKGLS